MHFFEICKFLIILSYKTKKDILLRRCLFVRRMRLELTRSCDHYPLKVACIPISPPARCAQNRTRTCTSLNTRTWNERVYQFRHLGVASATVYRLPILTLYSKTFLENKSRNCVLLISIERQTRLELATPTLARLCSTNWAIAAKC